MSILSTGAKNDLAKIVKDGVNAGDSAETIAAALQAAWDADRDASLKAAVAAARQNGNIGSTGVVAGTLDNTDITAGGTGYFIGDHLPITGSVSGANNAFVRVDMVDDVVAGGAITAISLVAGTGYTFTDVLSISTVGVGGADAVIDITGLAATANTVEILDGIDAAIDALV